MASLRSEVSAAVPDDVAVLRVTVYPPGADAPRPESTALVPEPEETGPFAVYPETEDVFAPPGASPGPAIAPDVRVGGVPVLPAAADVVLVEAVSSVRRSIVELVPDSGLFFRFGLAMNSPSRLAAAITPKIIRMIVVESIVLYSPS